MKKNSVSKKSLKQKKTSIKQKKTRNGKRRYRKTKKQVGGSSLEELNNHIYSGDPNQLDKFGRTPLILALKRMRSSESPNIDLIKKLLENDSLNTNQAGRDGETPLTYLTDLLEQPKIEIIEIKILLNVA